MKTLRNVLALSILTGLALSSSARAAVLPVEIAALPLAAGLSGAAATAPALSLKSIALPALPSASFPSVPAAPGPLLLPGAAIPLPLSLPARLADEDIVLHWNVRGPKPRTPAAAAAQLQFAARAVSRRPSARFGADELFDQASARVRVAIP
jgi:hypothetical protein